MINFENDKVVEEAIKTKKEHPFEIAKVKCEICGNIIARCRVDQLLERDLSEGFRGSDFMPVKPDWPFQWPNRIDWIWMKCPYCKKRPFYYKAMFTDENGDKKGWIIPCTKELCPESFDRKQKINYHIKKDHYNGG